jgi:hypothetical protein
MLGARTWPNIPHPDGLPISVEISVVSSSMRAWISCEARARISVRSATGRVDQSVVSNACASCGDRRVHIGLGGVGHAPHDLFGRRVDDLDGAGACRRHQLPADVETILLDHVSDPLVLVGSTAYRRPDGPSDRRGRGEGAVTVRWVG